jgi:hypothetical protein
MRSFLSLAPAKIGRRLIVPGIAIGLLWMGAGCDTRPTPPAVTSAPAADRDGFAPASSPLGAYLAARLAQANGDSKAAAEYYLAALGSDADSTELTAGAFLLMLADGRFDDAVPLAEKLLTYDQEAPLPRSSWASTPPAKGNIPMPADISQRCRSARSTPWCRPC